MKKILSFFLVFVVVFSLVSSVKAAERLPQIQIAILLDTSNSMDGLISQAKSQLWKLVNEFIGAEQNKKTPILTVALYEYGNNSLSSSSGYIRQVSSFTRDLDKISEELFALDTNGGSEYCGAVIKAAVDQLKWGKVEDDLRVIFIAGNEPFTQGNVNYKEACQDAKDKDVIVNTVFCNSYDLGVKTKWKEGADLTGGTYMNIDQDKKAIYIAAPQDDEIKRLGLALNDTYIAYGSYGLKSKERQAKQEANAKAAAPSAPIQRSVTKASGYYKASSWDLVDAIKDNSVSLESIKKEDLPKNMQKMTLLERKKYVAQQSEKRTEIQNKIKKLNQARKKYVAKKMKELTAKGEDTLDSAMIKALRKQAKARGFKLQN